MVQISRFSSPHDWTRWLIAIPLLLCLPTGARAQGRLVFTSSPGSGQLVASEAAQVPLTFLAVDPLVQPTLAGVKLANSLPTGGQLVILPDGTTVFRYADTFAYDYRGRSQTLNLDMGGGVYWEDLGALPPGSQLPKILLDLYDLTGLSAMAMPPAIDEVHWVGAFTYRFDFGVPVLAFRLHDTTGGGGKTVVGDPAFDAGQRVIISASTDGTTWTEIWRSPGPGGTTEVTGAELPSSLLGGTQVYLKFEGSETSISELYVEAVLDTPNLASLTSFSAGSTAYSYSDDPSSSHKAVVTWSDPRLTTPDDDVNYSYPSSSPRVQVDSQSIEVAFPEGVALRLTRDAAGGIGGIQWLLVGNQKVLDLPPATYGQARLTIVDPGTIGAITDWPQYLLDRQANGMVWVSTGSRTIRSKPLAEIPYASYRVEQGAVILRFEDTSTVPTGVMEWRLTPMTRSLGTLNPRTYQGLGIEVSVQELGEVRDVVLLESQWVETDAVNFVQAWGQWLTDSIQLTSTLRIPKQIWYGEAQPFQFLATPSGIATGFCETPCNARLTQTEDGGALTALFELPFGKPDGQGWQKTATKTWLWSPGGPPSALAAADEWTAVLDDLDTTYRGQYGLAKTDLEPGVFVDVPSQAYMDNWFANGPLPVEQTWWVTWADSKLPTFADLGVKRLFLVPWEEEAEHPTELRPGSGGEGLSWNAIWSLEVSPAQGGVAGLKYLVDKAHALGMEVVLWSSPGHFSNSSPQLVNHPDWLAWRAAGTPEDADYLDITGVGAQSGYTAYAEQKYKDALAATGADGVWSDSFLTYGVYADYSKSYPVYPLESTLQFLKTFATAGAPRIHIEGVGPMAVSTGGFGAEGLVGGASDPLALKRHQEITGREFGTYRYYADLVPDENQYFRVIASGGYPHPLFSSWFDDPAIISDATKAFMTKQNQLYRALKGWMDVRRLLENNDAWIGVEWTDQDDGTQVVYAFEAFDVPVESGEVVFDYTDGAPVALTGGSFTTTPYHVYTVRAASAVPLGATALLSSFFALGVVLSTGGREGLVSRTASRH